MSDSARRGISPSGWVNMYERRDCRMSQATKHENHNGCAKSSQWTYVLLSSCSRHALPKMRDSWLRRIGSLGFDRSWSTNHQVVGDSTIRRENCRFVFPFPLSVIGPKMTVPGVQPWPSKGGVTFTWLSRLRQRSGGVARWLKTTRQPSAHITPPRNIDNALVNRSWEHEIHQRVWKTSGRVSNFVVSENAKLSCNSLKSSANGYSLAVLNEQELRNEMRSVVDAQHVS